MTQYVIRRLLIILPVLVLITIAVFAAIRFIPGDPARLMGSGPSMITQETYEQIKAYHGLDKPVIMQYFIFMSNLFQGDLGTSIHTGLPVTQEIMHKLPTTLRLVISALVIASVVGIVAGTISAVRQYSIFDYITTLFIMFAISVPIFWLGLLLMLLFSVYLGWLPVSGTGSVRHMVLPIATLTAAITAMISRMVRSSVLDVLQQDYVRTARAKGLSEVRVILRHVLKNSFIPVVTTIGLMAGGLLTGTVVVEVVFAWPGMGRLLVEGILSRDYPVVQGLALVLGVWFVLINLAVDISYAYLDPRIRYQ